MKKESRLFWVLLLGVLPSFVHALPNHTEVISGDVIFHETSAGSMIIEASDKSIIHYESFDIHSHEKIQFLQPSSRATVLNRIVGENPTKIFGKLESNGRLFLVNSNGIYFGKESEVNVGSLVASTLDIANTDFLESRYVFSLQTGKGHSEIVNQGVLKGGLIALCASHIRNEGVIIAEASSVLLASDHKIVLDFEGTGLMLFEVDGYLEQSQVPIKVSSIDSIVKQVINADNIKPATTFVSRGGTIKLMADSEIKANNIEVMGCHLEVEGFLDATSDEIGGTIHLLGKEIFVGSSHIDASGERGGGEILIGGDLHGEGPYVRAHHVNISAGSQIFADAHFQGNGGKVVVWSDESAIFNGKIFARGGPLGGDGGLVETSGAKHLQVEVGQVSTQAFQGQRGTWLLDPLYIEIVSGATDTSLTDVSNCLDLVTNYSSSGVSALGGISNTVINQSSTNVVLCASGDGGTIIVSAPIATSVDLTLSVPTSGSIVLNRSIATASGEISLQGPVFVGAGVISLDTTNGGTSVGANILCTATIDGGLSTAKLQLAAGAGEIECRGAIGKSIPLQAFTVTSGSKLLLSADVITNSTSTGVAITPPLLLMGNLKIDTTKSGAFSGAPIVLSGGVDGTFRLFLNAGSSNVSMAASGQDVPLSAIQIKANNIILLGDIAASGGTMIFEGAVSISADLTLTDTGPTGIIFEDAVNCSGIAHTLTLSAPIGKVSLLAGIGDTLPPTTLTISAHLIQFGGDVTVDTTLTLNNAVEFLEDLTISALTMLFADTVDGSYDINLDATAAGTITFDNVVGSISPIGNLTIVDVDTLSAQGIYALNITQTTATGLCTYDQFLNTTGSMGISLTGDGGFEFSGGIQAINGGGLIIQSASDVTATSVTDIFLSNQFLHQGGGTVNWQGNIVTDGGDISFSGPLVLTGPVIVSSGEDGSGSISFADAIDGAFSFSLTAGQGDVTFSSDVGTGTTLGDILLTSANDVTAGAIEAQSYTQVGGYGTAAYGGNITTIGSVGINITSNYMDFTGTLQTTDGNIVINAILDGIGSSGSPVAVSVNGGSGTLFVGSASPAYFSGTASLLCAVRSNVPCFIEFNGTEYTPTTCCVSP